MAQNGHRAARFSVVTPYGLRSISASIACGLVAAAAPVPPATNTSLHCLQRIFLPFRFAGALLACLHDGQTMSIVDICWKVPQGGNRTAVRFIILTESNASRNK